jgi:hypothetical protein
MAYILTSYFFAFCRDYRESGGAQLNAKKDVSFAQFFYRVNPNRTIDSICGFCFLTVATDENKAALRTPELTHCCELSLFRRSEIVGQRIAS